MKKLICTCALLAAVLWAVAQDVVFRVSGEVRTDLKKVSIFLLGSETKTIGKAEVKSGLFEYQGTQPKDALLGVGTEEYYLPFINDGTPITVFFVDNELGDMKVEGMPLLLMSGSEQNVQLAKVDRSISKMDETMTTYFEQLQKKATPDNMAQLQQEAMTMYQTTQKAKLEELNNYRQTLIPVAFIPSMMQELNYEQLKTFMDPALPCYNHPQMAKTKEYYEVIGRKQPGQPFHDITVADIYGREHKLSEWCGKGNYVLVDFWASWCGPCRQEMPNVVECYSRYHGKKAFDVVGISLDEDANAWKAAIKKLGMAWTQLSDLKGWSSKAAEAYGVMAIPSNVLVDPKGQIIATDLRGEELKATLSELFDD